MKLLRILLIEDEEKISSAIQYILKAHDYRVDIISDGILGYDYARNEYYDLIILDVMLPNMDGFTILKKLKENKVQTPIIMLSAKGEVGDRIHGLNLGADDYLPKPFAMEELLSRMHAILRRTSEVDDEKVYLDRHDLSINFKDEKASLTLKEYQVFELLLNNKNRILSKEIFIDRIWGLDDDVDERIVEVYISFIRKKIKLLELPLKIQTVRGAGYRLEGVMDV